MAEDLPGDLKWMAQEHWGLGPGFLQANSSHIQHECKSIESSRCVQASHSENLGIVWKGSWRQESFFLLIFGRGHAWMGWMHGRNIGNWVLTHHEAAPLTPTSEVGALDLPNVPWCLSLKGLGQILWWQCYLHFFDCGRQPWKAFEGHLDCWTGRSAWVFDVGDGHFLEISSLNVWGPE